MRAVIIASGPSLTVEDIEAVRKSNRAVFVINNTVKIVPFANYLYACDEDLIAHYNGFAGFEGQKWTTSEQGAIKFRWNHVPGYNEKTSKQDPFPTDKMEIAYGGNSGFQCLNLAYHLGYRDVILLGYDMGFTDKKHWFGDHEPRIDRHSNYPDWIKRFDRASTKINQHMIVANASRQTALKCFQRRSLEDALDADKYIQCAE